jgi:cytochrome b
MTTDRQRGREAGLVTVWDPFVRIFHWLLVLLIAAAWLTGDDARAIHTTIGYAIITLVALRLLWGLAGPRHARFVSFVRSPRETLRYLSDLRHGREKRYLGHNPAGAAMIVALLAMVSVALLTGWLMLTDRFWGSSLMEELHETAAVLILLLVAVHVAGVVLESIRHRENLVTAMINGKKHAESE